MQQQTTERAPGRRNYQHNLLQSTYRYNLHLLDIHTIDGHRPIQNHMRSGELNSKPGSLQGPISCEEIQPGSIGTRYLLPASYAIRVTKPGSIFYCHARLIQRYEARELTCCNRLLGDRSLLPFVVMGTYSYRPY
ncbi:hypothetical protein DPMN_084461 [Dreissena polymorpha]|uniref:Uncharacterized protein n=1 Tax=Dreissena polymorpha TaxID=45954 RepID=A0A9D3YEL3_DREPO|nr:hypothetical protein DPMN_084461 [Dreissena polymorpha]